MTGGAVSGRLLRRAVAPAVLAISGALVVSGCGGAARPSLETGSTVSLQHHQVAAVRHVQQHPGESIVASAGEGALPAFCSAAPRPPFTRGSQSPPRRAPP